MSANKAFGRQGMFRGDVFKIFVVLESVSSSDDTSTNSSSFMARFYKGSLKVSEARARLDRKIAKLGKTQAQNVWNESDFCSKISK